MYHNFIRYVHTQRRKSAFHNAHVMVEAGDAKLKRMEEADKIIRQLAESGMHDGGLEARKSTQGSAHLLAKVWFMMVCCSLF